MSIDFNDLADRIAADLDIDYRAAREGLEVYIEQIEDVDDRIIDRDAISDADADFLAGAYRAGQEAQGLR